MQALQLLTPRVLQPLTLAEAKLHLRVDNTDEDDLIASLIVAATDAAEHYMGRAVLPQTWVQSLDAFADASVLQTSYDLGSATQGNTQKIALYMPPVTAITTITYLRASDGTQQTLASNAYKLAKANDYLATVEPVYGTSWPSVRQQSESVQITFVTGYADAASVPALIKSWVKMRLGALYQNRESWTVGRSLSIAPNPHIDLMLDRYRAWVL